jgi:HSP20 family protein
MDPVTRIFLERRDMPDDLRRVLDLLGDEEQAPGSAGECTPPCDVVETSAGIEVVMDLPGVTRESLKIAVVRNTLVIAGQKLPATCDHRNAAFHLAERTFGRFVRAVRLTGAFNGGAATARLAAGELRVRLPRIQERRGGEIRIAVQAD